MSVTELSHSAENSRSRSGSLASWQGLSSWLEVGHFLDVSPCGGDRGKLRFVHSTYKDTNRAPNLMIASKLNYLKTPPPKAITMKGI